MNWLPLIQYVGAIMAILITCEAGLFLLEWRRRRYLHPAIRLCPRCLAEWRERRVEDQ